MSAFMVADETINTPRQEAEETGMSKDIGTYECRSICIPGGGRWGWCEICTRILVTYLLHFTHCYISYISSKSFTPPKAIRSIISFCLPNIRAG
jgi:hypothetical protein